MKSSCIMPNTIIHHTGNDHANLKYFTTLMITLIIMYLQHSLNCIYNTPYSILINIGHFTAILKN